MLLVLAGRMRRALVVPTAVLAPLGLLALLAGRLGNCGLPT
jgi:hypothetical protein